MVEQLSSDENAMPSETFTRLRALRIRSKRGENLDSEDVAFLTACWKKWPDEYKALEREVFEATAPFGSQI